MSIREPAWCPDCERSTGGACLRHHTRSYPLPSPSPRLETRWEPVDVVGRDLIIAYARMVRNRAQTGIILNDDDLLALWEQVKDSAKGGDVNSGASKSERSPDMNSAVSGEGATQPSAEPLASASKEVSPAKAAEPPKTEPSTCSQCGKPWAESACGPSHAGIHAWRQDGRREAFEEAAQIADEEAMRSVRPNGRAARKSRAIAKMIRLRAEEGAE